MASGGAKILEFLSLVGKLKGLKRTGWVKREVPEPETVASHMYRMAIMTFFLDEDSSLDRDKCMKLALVHDMAESIVGDITPTCGVSDEEKHKREKEAMEHILTLAGPNIGKEFLTLWEEYENSETPESKVVHEIDKFDMILQAYDYETAEPDRGRFLQEFFDSTKGKFKHSVIKDWESELNKLREQSKKRSNEELNNEENCDT